MKKNFLILAAVLVALVVGFASCGSSDDDVNNGGGYGEEDLFSWFEGSGTLVINGETFEVPYCDITHLIPWGEVHGIYLISVLISQTEADGETYYTSPMGIDLEGDFLNDTYDLTKKMRGTGKFETDFVFDCASHCCYPGQHFKSGTVRVMFDEAEQNVTIETQGVAHDTHENKDIEFSLTFTGKGKVYNRYLAKEPNVPYGDGWFNGSCSLTLNGVDQNMNGNAYVRYDWGEIGTYNLSFIRADGNWVADIYMPVDRVGATYDLTQNLSGAYGETLSCLFSDYEVDFSVFYNNELGDFKSGTIFVSIDPAGNLKVDLKGVGNMQDDPSDSDVAFELHYTGKGSVDK